MIVKIEQNDGQNDQEQNRPSPVGLAGNMAPQPGATIQAEIGFSGIGGFAPGAYDKIFAYGRNDLNVVVIHMPVTSYQPGLPEYGGYWRSPL